MAAVAQISARQLLLLDLKLEKVNNWGATSATNDPSTTTYATAAAVKAAYDLAAAALPANSLPSSSPKWTTARKVTLTGDATGNFSIDGSADVSFVTTLANSGVAAGTYGKVTVNAKGIVTAGAVLTAADIPDLDWAKITTGKPTTLAGYGITDAVSSSNGAAPKADKLTTPRPFTIGLAAAKNFDGSGSTAMTWTLADIGAYAAAGGGIAGDFWRSGAGTNQFGLVDHLGWHTDAKPSLVLLAKKYVGTALDKTGFVGRILFNRGGATSGLTTDFVDVNVSVGYTTNHVRMLRRSGPLGATLKLVEVTHNSEVYYALYRGSASSAEVVLHGHAFDSTLPLLIADATAYTVTDIVTVEEDYHSGNKPAKADVGLSLVDNAQQLRAENVNGYWGMVDGVGSNANYIRTTTSGILPSASGGASNIGTSTWPFLTAYVNTIYEGGTALSAKYLAKTGGSMAGKLTMAMDGEGILLAAPTDDTSSYIRSTVAGVNHWYLGKGSSGVGKDSVEFHNYVYGTNVSLQSGYVQFSHDPRTAAAQGTAVNSLVRYDYANNTLGDTTAAVSTLARRDASGDINVRLLRSNYADQTTISGAMAFRVNNSSDNYVRYCSDKAAIRAYLDVAAMPDTPYKVSVSCATAAALTATYANGTSGVGATLTNSGTLAALTVDGYAVTAGERVLIKDQASTAQNGIYVVTNAGSASVAWVLTRSADADTNLDLAAAVVAVDKGTVNGSKLFTNLTKSVDTIGTTAVVWYEVAMYGTAPAASKALVSDAGGRITSSAASATEVGYLAGVTSAIQTQINAKQATITGAATTVVTSNLTASKALVSDVNGKIAASAVTATEMDYLAGVTSDIQTQLNGKFAAASVNTAYTATWAGTISKVPMVNSSGVLQLARYIDFHTTSSVAAYDFRFDCTAGVLTGTGALVISGNITAFSDERLKDNFGDIDDALGKTDTLRIKTFDRVDMPGVRQAGVIAQDVQKVLPEAVMVGEDGYLSVSYGALAALALKAIQELKQQVSALTGRVLELEGA